MIRAKALDCITLSVRDLARSIKWYADKFGFRKLYDDAPNSKGVVIGQDDIQLCLQQIDDPENARLVDHPKDICVRLFAFRVSEEDLIRIHEEFSDDPDIIIMDDHPKYRSRIIEDPDGHCIELYTEKTV